MVNVDKSVLARYKKNNAHFEVLVDCNLALDFRSGKNINITDILAVQKVFTDSKKGIEASPNVLKQTFGVEDPLEVAKEIIKHGEIQLNSEYKAKMREEKRKHIISIIHKNAVDPKSHTPHPIARIEAAMNDAKVKIDEYASAEQQVKDIIKKIQAILPIKFELKHIQVVIPGKYSGNAHGVLKNFGKMIKEEWLNDGSFMAVVEIPGGLEEEFYDKLNSLTHGDNETKIISTM